MIKKILIVCVTMTTVLAGAGTFETEDLFSITLPEGWVRMPDDVLVSYAEAMDEMAADEDVQVYDYGFQLENEQWLSYPCIMVSTVYLGRFSTGDLERYAQDAGGEDASLISDKTLFMEVREQKGVKVLIARQLTEYGFLELSGFATADNFDQYEGIFRDAFSNLQLDERIRYQPRFTDNAPVIGNINLGKVLWVCVQGAIVGGILWLIYGLLKRIVVRRSPKSA